MYPQVAQEFTDPPADNLLRVYAYYRVLLSALLLLTFGMGFTEGILGNELPELFLFSAVAYLSLSVLTLAYFWRQEYESNITLLFFMLLTDMACITLMMHASGGLDSGLGFLFVVTVAAGSIFVAGRLSLLLASVASIFIITESLIGVLTKIYNSQVMFPAGLLGILIFTTALLFQILTRRIKTAHELATAKAREASHLQQLNNTIIQQMRTGILVVDRGDMIQLINGAAIQLLGGQQSAKPLSPKQHLRVIPTLSKQLESWRAYPWLRTPSFKPTPCSSDIQANFTSIEQDGVEQILIFLEDTRTLAQHAQQLKLSSLSRLTGSIAHEIRNPLGAISHASQLLGEQAISGENNKLVDIIQRQTGRVNQIIENVLQISRQKAPEFQKLWIDDWLNTFRTEYIDCQQDKCSIDIENSQSNSQVFFDPAHLSRILNNLLDNALRYSEQETGQRQARLALQTDQQSGLLFLDIIDRGPGISREDLDSIFEPFFTTSHQGSGLGLYISKQLCEVNYASLSYIENNGGTGHFRIGFSHPDRLLPRTH